MARVSVIVPLYNKERYLCRALDSITAQSFGDFEVIVVDDGSTDQGAALAANYPDRRFRVLHQPNAGPGAARNRGLADAVGEYVTFLDADDEWLPDFLHTAVAALGGSGREAATWTSAYFDCPGGRSTEAMWRRRGLGEGIQRVSAETPPEQFVHMLAFMTPCTTVARLEVLRKWGGFYARSRCHYAEDAFLWLKILLNEPVMFSPVPRVRIHRDAASLSDNRSGPRPLEPFLEDPDPIRAACPEECRPLLERFYTIRAFKTACVWGYWGQWRPARALRSRFRTARDYRLPYYWSSLICSQPLGAAAGSLWRAATR
jgi:glycosyltransferase involved in cell wall biosynthesis